MLTYIKGVIVYSKYEFQKEGEYLFQQFKPNPEYEAHKVFVQEHTLEVHVPDNFDPTNGMVENLQALKTIAQQKFSQEMMLLDKQINNLLALPNEVK